jgi:hypothetical protein
MKYRDLGSAYNVSVSRAEVEAFKRQYPCSGLPDKAITFQFDARNGDLVDIWPDSSKFDGSGLLALSQDAQAYGRERIDINARLQKLDAVNVWGKA